MYDLKLFFSFSDITFFSYTLFLMRCNNIRHKCSTFSLKILIIYTLSREIPAMASAHLSPSTAEEVMPPA